MSAPPASPDSSAASGRADEAARLRRALALMQDSAAQHGAEVAELAIAPLRQRLAALDARDANAADAGVPPLRQVSVLFVDVVDSTHLLRGLDAEDGHQMLDGALRRFGATVHAHGGRVLRYTGDGLKAVFGMPEAAEDDSTRAVRAGLEILQHARAHAAEVHRQFGLAGFAVRAGIHSGPLAMAASAEDGHTLVGATVHLAARLEQNAPAGSLCISHETWRAVCGSFDVQARGLLSVKGLEAPVPSYRVLCERAPGQRATLRGIDTAPMLGNDVVDPSIPEWQATTAVRAAAAGPEQALKQVCVLLLNVVGFMALSQQIGLEAISDFMDGALARGTSIVDAHGGRVLQYAGHNLLAVFGADEAQEDDAERAVRCGLDLLALGAALKAEVSAAHGHDGLDVRAGIHLGRVLLGGGVDEVGSISGIAVHIAARMEQTAPAGGLRISQATYTQVRGVFDVIPQDPLALKGVETPVTSYLVQRLKPRAFRVQTRGIEGIATRMIGRDAELEALQDAFRRLVETGAGLERVAIVADAGVGKSRLLDEFRNWAEARAERYFVFQARATPQTQGQGHGLLRDLLAWRFEISDSDAMDVAKQKLEAGIKPLFIADEGEAEAEAHAHLLGQLIGLDYSDSHHIREIKDDGQQIRNRGFNAAAQALRRIAAQGGSPVVLYLDDLHWADDASLDFVDHLARVNRDVPLLLVTLMRPTLFERRPDHGATKRVDLRPLDRGNSRDLANELLKNLVEVPAALRELLTARADGNPFYMEELVKMLIDQKAIDTSGAQWSVDAKHLLTLKVPQTLTGVLQARLDGLPRPERHALQLASVIGQNFWDAALAHIEAGAAAELRGLSQRRLVNPKDAVDRSDDIREYAFSHQILHQVTYDTVLKRIKRAAHARTAQWLAEHSGARAKALLGTAAGHYEQAGDAAHAAELYAQAAEHAASTFANEAVLDHVARSLQLAAPDAHGLRRRLHAAREGTLDLLGRRSAQRDDIDALKVLADALDDDCMRADVALRHALFALRTGDYDTADVQAQRATALATRAGNEDLALLAAVPLGVAMSYRGNPSAGRAIADAALARAQALGLLLGQGKLANAAAICAAAQRDWFAGLRYQALNLSTNRSRGDRRGEAMTLGNMGILSLCLGDLATARQHLDVALGLNRSQGARPSEGINLTYLSEIAWRRGDDAQALTDAEAAVAILTEVRAPLYLSEALRSLGNAELALGRYAAGAAAFERGEAVARETGNAPRILEALEAQARLALARGDGPHARATVARLLVEAGGEGMAVLGPAAAGPSAQLSSARNPLIHLTMHRVWLHDGDSRANAALAEAHRCLHVTADAISNAALRHCYLNDIAEHREIEALFAHWERLERQERSDADLPQNNGSTV